jgi:hypothetical protein
MLSLYEEEEKYGLVMRARDEEWLKKNQKLRRGWVYRAGFLCICALLLWVARGRYASLAQEKGAKQEKQSFVYWRDGASATAHGKMHTIPKVVHVVFPESGPLSMNSTQKRLLNRFAKMHPSFVAICYNHQDIKPMMEQLRPDIFNWWMLLKSEMDRYHFWKYALLYAKGGVFLEASLFRDLIQQDAWPDVLTWLDTEVPQPGILGSVLEEAKLRASPNRQKLINQPRLPAVIFALVSQSERPIPITESSLFSFSPSIMLSPQFIAAQPFHPLFRLLTDAIQNSPPPHTSNSQLQASPSSGKGTDIHSIRTGAMFMSHVTLEYISDNILNPQLESLDFKLHSKKATFSKLALERIYFDTTVIRSGYHCCKADIAFIPEQNLFNFLQSSSVSTPQRY